MAFRDAVALVLGVVRDAAYEIVALARSSYGSRVVGVRRFARQ